MCQDIYQSAYIYIYVNLVFFGKVAREPVSRVGVDVSVLGMGKAEKRELAT